MSISGARGPRDVSPAAIQAGPASQTLSLAPASTGGTAQAGPIAPLGALRAPRSAAVCVAASVGIAEPSDVTREADTDFLSIRNRLFHGANPTQREQWLSELAELAALGYGAQADRHLERVLGLPAYRYHDVPGERIPADPFESVPRTALRQAHMHAPEPSRLAYLLPVRRALALKSYDVLYDIGAGLGKAAMFFSAFTPVRRVVGIEVERAYASYAATRASQLGLSNVEIRHADVMDVDLSPATAFYFYNPFKSVEEWDGVGRVADQLAELAAEKPLRIAVKGPAMQQLLRQSGRFAEQRVLDHPAVWILFTSG